MEDLVPFLVWLVALVYAISKIRRYQPPPAVCLDPELKEIVYHWRKKISDQLDDEDMWIESAPFHRILTVDEELWIIDYWDNQYSSCGLGTDLYAIDCTTIPKETAGFAVCLSLIKK